MRLSETENFPWDEERVRSRDPEDRVFYFKTLIKRIRDVYGKIATAVNVNDLWGKSGAIDVNSNTVPQLTLGRDTDGTVGLLLERRYIGKYDWLILNAGHFEIYGDDGAGSLPTSLRLRITDLGVVEMYDGATIWGGLGVIGGISVDEKGSFGDLAVTGLPVYANNAAAITGGLLAGDFYRTGGDPDLVCVVH